VKALRITPTRAELLQAIGDGAVADEYSFGQGFDTVWDRGAEWATRWRTKRYRAVTASVRLLVDHGLVKRGPRPASRYDRHPWVLTAAGEMALKAATS
jgi:hypothetical protein